ncbi:uncharacterized protein GVI51_M00253 [Nakaseomyces glabratus]|uniref:Vacuolar membrane-associated protein IML1 n=1 Tax=Candida glabrata (strain ATCC 2001 / BCRC 20586 / JCM 3761 / NBRC 0622 / NRRL Y-65 / CBS 138) TaxID=284593 RepID=IML1_CANGA|nr:uncharacterized protein CAGL0M00352g [Nakaseomyces glabratus]Q6FK84.1 RecName: Full=Vacuolar membrane-associated protein IML1 [Nakaseomyces glabratus CBS 138]KAH7593540.1 Domain found in Dishevelled, Egl-10, and Pleckstrin (DEP) [Nakaseomyces glabratus]KAH7599991.1 Domain found in Dishevelled, Egl-10, and Pleckstrin (DEP) [Nakaseomyces glabratus]QHS69040.1 uncharacterized protein GVI51_M00253 [Nakaseomyces glabratus]CAG62336.1 unnamed protein product [Nakaseomyces glabratus]|eukprot:XP_449360.1 uncharacterized protein CAGL0M00352g [[Candida] glabrata]
MFSALRSKNQSNKRSNDDSINSRKDVNELSLGAGGTSTSTNTNHNDSPSIKNKNKNKNKNKTENENIYKLTISSGRSRGTASNTTNANTLVLNAGVAIVGKAPIASSQNEIQTISGQSLQSGIDTNLMTAGFGRSAGIDSTTTVSHDANSVKSRLQRLPTITTSYKEINNGNKPVQVEPQDDSHYTSSLLVDTDPRSNNQPQSISSNAVANVEINRTLQLDLVYHESRVSEKLVMLDLKKLPHIKEGQLCELRTYRKRKSTSARSNKNSRDKKLYFIAHDFDEETRKRCHKFGNISVALGQLQLLLDLPPRSRVWIKPKRKEDTAADLIELHIKDILVNRGDMWCMSSELVDTCVFTGQRIMFLDSIRTTVNGIYKNGKKVLSGYINDNTKIVFRSESSRLLFIIQITNEMWSFDESGEQMFQKMINSFFPKIFNKWKDIETHHSITIAFAISMDMSTSSYKDLKPGQRIKNTTDYYRIVVDQVSVIYWVEIMESLRKEFMEITRELLSRKSDDKKDNELSVIKGRFAPVIKSNILELINFAATTIVDPFRQLDLRHTSTHVMIISPGKGLYDVDYDLLQLSCKKLLSLELTMDLICLSNPPLHVVPLFRYIDYENKLHHCIPPWLNIFFWNDKTKDTNKWTPRCQIYDLQMMGLTDTELVQELELDYLNPSDDINDLQTFLKDYDRDIFLPISTANFKAENISSDPDEEDLKELKKINDKTTTIHKSSTSRNTLTKSQRTNSEENNSIRSRKGDTIIKDPQFVGKISNSSRNNPPYDLSDKSTFEKQFKPKTTFHPSAMIKKTPENMKKLTNPVFQQQYFDIQTDNGLTGNSKNLLIKNTKYLTPIIDEPQTPLVTGNLYRTRFESQSNDNELNENSKLPERGGGTDERRNVSAADTLKDVTKKSSIKDFTQRIFTKFLATTKQSNFNSDGINSSAITEDAVLISDDTDGKTNNNNDFAVYPSSVADGDVSGDNQHRLNNKDSFTSILKPIPRPQLGVKIFKSDINNLSSNENVNSETKQNLLGTRNTINRKQFTASPHFTSSTKNSVSNHSRFIKFDSMDDWIEILEDSIPSYSFLGDDLLPTRWRDVWPKNVFRKYSKWKSFTSPAELPITLKRFPSKYELENNFMLRNHSVTQNWEQEQYKLTTKDLLRNMIYLRLLVGFQICTSSTIEEVESARKGDRDVFAIHKYLRGDLTGTFKIYMLMGSEIHRLHYDNSGTINVERYIEKSERNVFDQVPSYTSFVKTRYDSNYRKTDVDPIHTKRSEFNWNLLDQLLAGYSDPYLYDEWHGFRSKYVILPAEIPSNTFSMVVNGKNETLTTEEIRVEGLRKLIASITRLKLLSVEESKIQKDRKTEIQPEVIFYTGSLFDFLNEQQAQLDSSTLNFKDSIFGDVTKKLNKNIDLKNLAQELQMGENKLNLVTRKWHWKRHANCFVGSEMVNWLIRNFSDIDTRSTAISYGQKLMNDGLFIHVLDKHSFLDGNYFYQISPEFIINMNTVERTNSKNSNTSDNNTLKKTTSRNSTESNLTPLSMRNKVSTMDDDSTQLANTTSANSYKEKKTVVLSNSMLINVDPSSKSYKEELCTVHFDRVHNPEHCFHIRLEWLTTTPKLIDNMLGNWARICEKYGLKLIEIPWNELCTIPSVDPFHTFVQLHLVINPWEDPEFNDPELFAVSKFYYHIHLLKMSGFLLDNRASRFFQRDDADFEIMYSWGKPQFKYAQYIHTTGAYIAEMRENGNIFLAPNNVYMSRVNRANVISKTRSSPTFTVDSRKVVIEFSRTCYSYAKLRAVFLDAKEKWLSNKTVED